MKYKACCGMRCLVAGCEINENGGCYCACRLSDRISLLEGVIKGKTLHRGCVYYPSIEARNENYNRLSDERKKEEDDFMTIEAPQLLEKWTKIFNDEYRIEE